MPSKDSTMMRTARIVLYELAGLFIAVLTNPDAVSLLKQYYPEILAVLLGFVPIATFVVNWLRKDVQNW